MKQSVDLPLSNVSVWFGDSSSASMQDKPWDTPWLVPGNFIENAVVSLGASPVNPPGLALFFRKFTSGLASLTGVGIFNYKALAQVFSLRCSCSCSAILLNLQAQTCYKIVVPLVSVVVPYSFLLSRLCIFLLFCSWFMGLTMYWFDISFLRTNFLWFPIFNSINFVSNLFLYSVYCEFHFLLSCTSVLGILTTLTLNSQHNSSRSLSYLSLCQRSGSSP